MTLAGIGGFMVVRGDTLPAVDSGIVFLYNKDYTRARAFFAQRIKNPAASIDDHRGFQDACLKLDSGALRDSRRIYREMAEKNPQDPRILFLFGRCLPCEKGADYFTKVLTVDSCYPWALNACGACYFEAGDYLRASQSFSRAIACNPNFIEAYQNLAQVSIAQKRYAAAKEIFRKLIKTHRNQAKPYEWLGDLYLTWGKDAYALLAYQRSAQLGTRGPGIFFKIGYASFKVKKCFEAVEAYKRSISQGNTTYEVYYNMGTALEILDRPAEALESYEIAYDKNNTPDLLYAMGNCAVLLALYSKAIDSYRRYLEKNPRSTEALFGLANAFQMKKDYDSAVATYRTILSIDPGFSKAYYNLGSIYAYHLKDPQQMVAYWKKFVALTNDRAEAAYIQKEIVRLRDTREAE
jgi:tetratricopeptide (TPR) repeat protein